MTRFLIGGAVAAFAIAPVAVAQPAPPAPPGVASGTAPAPMVAPVAPMAPGAPHVRVMFNSDHDMTRAEVADHVAKMFAKLDANRDGFITKDEIEALHTKMMSAMGRAGDVEKRLAERGVMMGDRALVVDRLDTNHDGSISRQEFTAGRPQVRTEQVIVMRDGAPGAPGAHPPMEGMEGMDGMRMHMRHMGGMGMRGGFGAHMLEMADANHDGRVSLAEAQAAALAHFDKADLNHDGKITPDERGQRQRVMRIERRQG
jgi:hypothetical protein